MTLTKISPSGWSYYATEIAAGREDYFLASGIETTWVGSGAKTLGIHGELVTEEGLARLFGAGRDPMSGAALGRTFSEADASAVAGYAVTFSPPKTVSVLWATSDGETANAVLEGHRAAVDAALRFYEHHAAFTRRGKNGIFQVDTEGFIAAGFVHRTSRAADPQLHTHVLIANKVRAGDGAWLSLDGRELYAHQKAAGLLYKAALRAELTRRLGVSWTAVDKNGIAEIVGVPDELVARWSSRRQEVEVLGRELVAAREVALGRALRPGERAEAFQLAAFRSRAPKVTGEEPTEPLRSRWQEEAATWAHAPEAWLAGVLDRGPTLTEAPEAEIVRQAIAHVEDEGATFTRAEVLEVLSTFVVASSAREVREESERLADLLLADREVLRLAAPLPGEPPASLLRRDGTPVIERHGAARFSTRATLLREASMLEVATRGAGAGVAVVSGKLAEGVLDRQVLGGDQHDAVARLVTEGDRIACLVGPAGAGKSRALSALREIYERSGFTVVGLAPSASAAEVLHSEAGISAETLAKFLLGAAHGRAATLSARHVVVVDEASMARTDDLAQLSRLVEERDAKLVLVGDPHQLGAVGPGGLFRTLVERQGAVELETPRRFVHAWEGAATLRLRAGDAAILPTYLRHDRIENGTREAMLDVAFARWQEARADGRSVVVMAGDNATVTELALRCREARVQAGEVERAGVQTAHGTIGIGDEIVTLQNDRRLCTENGSFVRNGHRWTVTDRDGGALAVSSLEGHGSIWLPPEYVTENVALSYALTVHKAQGTTSDTAVLLVDLVMTAEQLYVGMTRGREENRALVITMQEGDGHTVPLEPSPIEVLGAVLRHHGEDRSAHDVLCDELAHAENRELLGELITESTGHIDRSAGPDRSVEIAELAKRVDLAAAERGLAEAEAAARAAAERREDAEAALEDLKESVRAKLPGRLGATARYLEQRTRDVATIELNEAHRAERQSWDALGTARHHLYEQRQLAGELTSLHHLQDRRESWIEAHPDELRWRDQLAERLATREAEAREAARAQALEVVRRELSSSTDRELIDQLREASRDQRISSGALHRHRGDLSRRERIVAGHPVYAARFAASDAYSRSRIVELSERLDEIGPHVAGIEAELSARGIDPASATQQPPHRLPEPDFYQPGAGELAQIQAQQVLRAGPHIGM